MGFHGPPQRRIWLLCHHHRAAGVPPIGGLHPPNGPSSHHRGPPGAGWDASLRSCAAFCFGWEPRLWISPHCSQTGAAGRGRRRAGHVLADLFTQMPSHHPPAPVTTPGHSNPAARTPHCRLHGRSGQNVSGNSCQSATRGYGPLFTSQELQLTRHG